jgi:hypothetical protein
MKIWIPSADAKLRFTGALGTDYLNTVSRLKDLPYQVQKLKASEAQCGQPQGSSTLLAVFKVEILPIAYHCHPVSIAINVNAMLADDEVLHVQRPRWSTRALKRWDHHCIGEVPPRSDYNLHCLNPLPPSVCLQPGYLTNLCFAAFFDLIFLATVLLLPADDHDDSLSIVTRDRMIVVAHARKLRLTSCRVPFHDDERTW